MFDVTTIATTAEALERQLRQAGFVPGVPRHLDERAQSIDAQVCRRMKCPGCHRRRMTYRPYHNGSAYRVVAACAACGSAEEV